jgi:hypothetical protein
MLARRPSAQWLLGEEERVTKSAASKWLHRPSKSDVLECALEYLEPSDWAHGVVLDRSARFLVRQPARIVSTLDPIRWGDSLLVAAVRTAIGLLLGKLNACSLMDVQMLVPFDTSACVMQLARLVARNECLDRKALAALKDLAVKVV